MVQTALGKSSISAGCGILAITISVAGLTRVRCRCIGVLDIPLWIGAFSGEVTFGAAFKADNIGITVEVVEVSSGTVVVMGRLKLFGRLGKVGRGVCGGR